MALSAIQEGSRSERLFAKRLRNDSAALGRAFAIEEDMEEGSGEGLSEFEGRFYRLLRTHVSEGSNSSRSR